MLQETAEVGDGRWPAIVVIGNPENRRVQMFCAAAHGLGLPPVRILAIRDLLDGRLDLASEVPSGSLVRLESPGENEPVERALIAWGAAETPRAEWPADYAPGEPIEHGRIYCTGLWYRGYCRLLESCRAQLEPRGVVWMSHPRHIALAFDKPTCQAWFDAAGIPVPHILGRVANYEDLRARMVEARVWRVFLKPAHGSSASGVVALQASPTRICATTSVELARSGGRTRLYNGLGLRRYDRETEVAELVDALGTGGLHLEVWMPKAAQGERPFDLRVVTIAGEIRHRVVRTSEGPITNLHLGNRRGDLAALLRQVPADRLEAAWDTCRQVAALLPQSLYLGIDLMFTPGFRRHAVLEVNAFGDLLPGVLDQGQDTYTAELAAAARASQCRSSVGRTILSAPAIQTYPRSTGSAETDPTREGP